MEILSFIGGLVIGSAVTHVFENKMTEDKSAKNEKPSQSMTADSHATERKQETVPAPVQPVKPAARLVMQREIARFNDLLEPLHMISQGVFSLEDSLATLEEWERRLSELTDADNLIKKWETTVQDYENATLNEVSNIAVRWVNLLASFEISRDNHNEVQVNESVRCAYDEINKEPLVDGESMIVKTAAWFKKTDVIRRGILVRKDA